MLTIALTTIPPRFSGLADVTDRLINQTIPVRVVVSIPKSYRRFPGEFAIPDLPDGVIVTRPTRDCGPATKLLGCLGDPQVNDILYCDDDWDYGSGWAEALLSVRPSRNHAVAASTFRVSRLKRCGEPPHDQIAQGFGGVLVRKGMFDDTVFDLPNAAYAADDIWLSGYLAAQRVPIIDAPDARALLTPRDTLGRQLQDTELGGMTRAQANTACVDAVTARYGIWPKKSLHGT